MHIEKLFPVGMLVHDIESELADRIENLVVNRIKEDEIFLVPETFSAPKYTFINGKNGAKPETHKLLKKFKKVNARLAAEEILDTHMGLTGKEASAYMDKNFEKTFKTLDPGNQGYIEVERMQDFFR